MGFGGSSPATEDDGELLMLVETDADVVGCSGCGTRARSKGRRRTRVRDLPVGGRPTVLVWSKHVWRCAEAACEGKSWSETSPLIRLRAVLSERARRDAARRVGEDGTSVAAVARSLGVGWSTIMDAVREFGEPMVEEQLGSLAGVRSPGTGRTPLEVPSGQVGYGLLRPGDRPAHRGCPGTFRGCCQGFSGL